MSHSYRLLKEVSMQVETLTEAVEDGKKRLFIEGIFAQSEVVNGNKRKYPKSVMESALSVFERDWISKNRAIGEIKHPDYPMPDPEQAAIRITEMKFNGNDVYGKAIVLDTPKGQIVRALQEGGYQWAVSTRGLGSLKESAGIKVVQSDFMMTAVDLVDNPSGPDCYVNGLTESVKWELNERGVWIPKVKEDESDRVNEQLFLEKLENYLKTLKKR